MIGVIEEKMGGIPELENELLDGIDLDLKEAKTRPAVNHIKKHVEKECEAKKKEISRILRTGKFSKKELREFLHELRMEILLINDELESIPASEGDYAEAVADVMFMFREISSLVGELIDADVKIRREAMTTATAVTA